MSLLSQTKLVLPEILSLKVPNNFESEVFSFVRQNENDKVFAVFNFSNQKKEIEFKESLHQGRYQDFENQASIQFDASGKLTLDPWGYKIFVK